MRAKRKDEFEPDYAVPPGATLHEVMESLQMSQKELAQRTGLTEQTLTRIFKGDQPISYETANRLELVTGVPARMWNNLEAQYREQLAKQEERQRLEADKAWLKTIPIKELIERGHVVPDDDKVNLVRKVLAFFGVCSVQAWQEIWAAPAVAARRSRCFESRPGDAAAWIRQGELQAQQIECAPFDKTRFSAALEEIRTLTREESVVFEPRMKQLCANAGVAVALVREMKKVPWNGATKWLTPNKAMILLSLRGKGEDKFWFSFFTKLAMCSRTRRRGSSSTTRAMVTSAKKKPMPLLRKPLFPPSMMPGFLTVAASKRSSFWPTNCAFLRASLPGGINFSQGNGKCSRISSVNWSGQTDFYYDFKGITSISSRRLIPGVATLRWAIIKPCFLTKFLHKRRRIKFPSMTDIIGEEWIARREVVTSRAGARQQLLQRPGSSEQGRRWTANHRISGQQGNEAADQGSAQEEQDGGQPLELPQAVEHQPGDPQ
jgi:Plasmid maintenance system antidote protein